jgi:hypothetical protein
VQQEDQRCGIGATIERFEFIHLDSRGASAGESGRHGGKDSKLKAGFPDLSRLS